jgi:c-di-GMP-binding flagellar brake protein YcgR
MAMDANQKAKEPESGEKSRRAAERLGVDEDATILLLQTGSLVACRVVDLSLSGCRLRTEERFPVGPRVRIEVHFQVRGLAFRFSGLVQWTDGRRLAGVRFADLPARRKQELAEALAEVESALTAKAAAANKPTTVSKPPQAVGQNADASPASATGRERRLQAREGIYAQATIHLINAGSRLTGNILDLSTGGCRIHTEERFPVGIYTRVEVEFSLTGMPFRLGGVVQVIHDRQTVGIRFLEMSERRREQIVQLIEEMRE